MTEDDLRTLGEAGEELSAATPPSHGMVAPDDMLRFERAGRAYADALTPVVGPVLSMQYHAAFERFLAASQRFNALYASVNSGHVDSADFLCDLSAAVGAADASMQVVTLELYAAFDRLEGLTREG